MKIIDSFRIVWRNLWRMKLRTALTSVGVMIGTAAIVAMIALSLGLKESAVKSLENFGNLTEMDVEPMYYIYEEDRMIPEDERKKLNMEAVQELKQIPGIAAVMPMKRLYEQAKLKVGRREGYVELIGVDVNESAEYRKNDVEKGAYLSGSPQEIVVAYDVPREMRDVEKEKRDARRRNADSNRSGGGGAFMPPDMGGGEQTAAFNLVDKAATIVLTREYRIDDEPKYEKKEVRVRVVGQLRQSENRRYSSAVYAPLSVVKELNDWVNRSRGDEGSDRNTRRTREEAKKDKFEFDQMTVKVESREMVESVVKALKEKGYEVWSPARELETINKFFFVIQMVLGGIAAISLLVATIGIVNTMIMSILERTKEIGIMKVIGATVLNIRWLFLMESGFIGLIGGLAGLGMAWGAVELVNYFGASGGLLDGLNMGYGRGGGEEAEPSKLAVIPAWLALFAIGFSFIIGLLAGIFPAIRASRLSALQAIRSE
ncbi:ABC transporter permease [Brevibacillus reuszeri]|uniref:ABC transporter permease n=1 Tax=Brevibacillus reuszeri TaxID=54915 RepID=UPI000CCBED74|nr:ABC transporter permease [Brevibacillus reuszeri]